MLQPSFKSALKWACLALALAFSAPARAEMIYPGVATWSGEQSGRYTAFGETYDADDLTCAHPTFPHDTLVRVWWRGRSVICRVNDRGPAKSTGVDIDLSRGAARELRMIDAGRVHVVIEKLGKMLE
ncbi:septal ring lytic transglycosylase RlpA family lipoprotein [Bradyrhizobium sp. WBOS4]|nr:septal ring lytic transglycosylase RlpA family lipoprotein [Bradyrhizobium sp. WBOS8]MDD1581461.1 septal ring lytic transglycosylase RlpA family lipoprotein [Bradyrhizobium sp. WBOS4]UUO49747.1 septal ring lytic transglycosylase RlpA family lipoprotein [Bradyrhizobium sp. WBOS04]UUO58513.1 septal ring lytic transglycosylase RlpA family lipoprotein [Bradyrhizobium sp. WBOS08]